MKPPLWVKFLQLLWLPVLGVFEYLRSEYDGMAGFRFLLLIGIVLIVYDYLQYKKHVRWFKHETPHTTATTTLLGMALALAAFDYDIAKTAIVMMVLGDIFAGVLRRTFIKERDHGWKGFAGCLFGCLIGGLLILNNGIIVLAMAVVASLMESYIFMLDDNLYMVMISGLVGQVLLGLIA